MSKQLLPMQFKDYKKLFIISALILLNAAMLCAQLPMRTLHLYINRSEYNVSSYAFVDLEQPDAYIQSHTGLISIQDLHYGLKSYSPEKERYIYAEESNDFSVDYLTDKFNIINDTVNKNFREINSFWDKILVEISDKQNENRRMTILLVGFFNQGYSRGNLVLDVDFEVGLFLVTIPEDNNEERSKDPKKRGLLLNPYLQKL
jgi:hypothetical protein